VPGAPTLAGAAIIVASGLAIAQRGRHRLHRPASANGD
jgi:hypothetical protein